MARPAPADRGLDTSLSKPTNNKTDRPDQSARRPASARQGERPYPAPSPSRSRYAKRHIERAATKSINNEPGYLRDGNHDYKERRRRVLVATRSKQTTRQVDVELIITPTFTSGFDMNFGANATAARAAWVAAAKIFTDAFTDDIHINITVDAVTTAGTFGRSFPNFMTISYADLFALVGAYASTENDAIAIGPGGSMTADDPTNGLGIWQLARPQAKALGFIPDDMSDDGGTTFGAQNAFTFSGPIATGTFDFKGIAAHEIAEVMGRIGLSGGNNTFSLIDNFAYSGAGTKALRGGAANFFSMDNGTTLLKQFNDNTVNHLDTRDWAGGTSDAFNQFSNGGVVNPVSVVDLQLMDVIGYGTPNLPGSVIETVGHVSFLRAHELGSGYGKVPNFLDCEVVTQLAEEPLRTFGFQLRADPNEPARREMFDLLRAAFVSGHSIRIDYLTSGPRVGEIIRVANP